MFWNITLAVLVIILLKKTIKSVPSVHFAVSTIFGERRKNYRSEGLCLAIPFIEKFPDKHLYSLKVDNISISFTFPTKDDLKLLWEGIIEYVPDPERRPNGYPRITNFTKDDLKKGLRERAQDEVKKLGGSYEAQAFKSRFSRSLRYFIESIMRLKRPPHVNPKKDIYGWEFLNPDNDISEERWEKLCNRFRNEVKISLQKRSKKEESDIDNVEQELNRIDYLFDTENQEEIPVEYRLEFYLVFSGPIGNMLREEEGHTESESENERYYGIDIQNVSNSNIDYTDKMWDALEAKKRSEKEVEGREEYHRQAMKMAKKIKSESGDDISFGDAYDKALTILGKASQKNFSFQGDMNNKTGMILEINDNE